MKSPEHGGNVLQTARELGLSPEAILDFSASINPHGVPQGVLAAIRASLARIQHYPEIDGGSLREALAAHHRLPAEHFLPGSGSTELIYLLPRVLRPRRALLVAPCFSEYERSLSQVGCAVEFLPLSPADGFSFDPQRLLNRLEPDTDLILIANPANPTGRATPPEALLDLAARVREQALVLIDEAFVDFCPEHSLLPYLGKERNLFVLRSLTKFYAIPGLRAGYLAGPPRTVARLAQAREPWTLSTPALAAAHACLAEEAFRRQTWELIPQWREQLQRGLEELGLRVFSSSANYLLARLGEGAPSATQVSAGLREKGILLRDCSNFPGLDQRYVRAAVRLPDENRRLLAALRLILQKSDI
ncbi:threonine-phosphate decarboxylase CobD [Geoalkalibacter sp.]|uniref:threonine-phosphate decarboxylase CobD n=1 Tax=Geoalkalibacter sp. TaxID=3041440 RepID=UPI00272DD4F2|nr:threonine-phosphate decarboxylase CobD [Geoalkalibacter sp.]